MHAQDCYAGGWLLVVGMKASLDVQPYPTTLAILASIGDQNIDIELRILP